MLRNFFSLTLLLFCTGKGFSQIDPNLTTQKVAPASPNAAALGKYGDIPVGAFTGIPSIGIPMFEYGNGSLKSSVSLSYHAGGIKVEEVASWVGLGWSLNAGGAITRSVRGIADESSYGYINNANGGMTVKFIVDSFYSPIHEANIQYNLQQAGSGQFDTEPDIFFFNFGSYSGKFYYNQERHRFYTIPYQELKINYDAASQLFSIVGTDGNTYWFADRETTNSLSNCLAQGAGSPTSYNSNTSTSSWMLSKVVNSNHTDSVVFVYANTYYTYETNSSNTKYTLLSTTGGPGSSQMKNQFCTNNVTISGKRLASVQFRNGSIVFNKSEQGRCDLVGDTALKSVDLFDINNRLVKRYEFSYGYFGYTGDCTGATQNDQRLKLTQVTERGINNGDTVSLPPYVFDYEAGTLPNRLSNAQDYWGYYNGATTNTDLVPSLFYTYIGNQKYFSGAQRKPDSLYCKYGTLNQITYPTGGYTKFTYEPNTVSDTLLHPEFHYHTESIEGDHNGGVQTYYQKYFTINNTANFFNGFNSSGGVYVDLMFAEIGCSFPGNVPNNCAVLTISDSATGSAVTVVTSAVKDYYLPNGSYKLTASFNQSPTSGYEDFYFEAKWKVADSAILNQLAGGLRVRKMEDYDGVSHGNDKVKYFSYVKEGSDSSSGKLLSIPQNFASPFTEYREYAYRSSGYCVANQTVYSYVKRTSNSNYPLLNSQGSAVNYKRVVISEGTNAANGKTVMNYSFMPDWIYSFPYPYTSREWERGQLLKEETYKNNGGASFTKVQAKENSFTGGVEFADSTNPTAIGIKVGFESSATFESDGDCTEPSLYHTQLVSTLAIPMFEEYETSTGKTVPQEEKAKSFSQPSPSDYIETATTYLYNNKNQQPNKVIQVNSIGDTVSTYLVYPIDFPSSSIPSWLSYLQGNNFINMPIEKYITKKKPGGSEYVVSATLTTFKSSSPLPDKLYAIEIAAPLLLSSFVPSYISSSNLVMDSRYKEQVSFNGYDAFYNVLSQNKRSNITSAYIWDYNAVYPIAETVNAAQSDIAYSSFEADGKGNWSYSGTASTDAASPTGTKYYQLSDGNITKSGMTSGTAYVVTYWKKDAAGGSVSVNSASGTSIAARNGWTLYRHEVTGTTSITVSGSAHIDELRLHPKDAMMMTYTYIPLVGMSTQCDANNKVTYYEYDSFNRLKLMKDQDRNIIKFFDYKYQATQNQ